MSFNRFFFGDKDRTSQLSTLAPQQQQSLSNVIGQISPQGQAGQNYSSAQQYLSRLLGGDKEAYNMFASPYIQNFEQQIIPQIAERFAGLGGPLASGEASSGFGQALSGAGAQLQAQLANLFANLQQNASSQAMGQYNNLANLGLNTRAVENIYQPGSTGALGGILSGAAQGLGYGFGGPFGAMAASGISGLFNNKNKDSNRSTSSQGFLSSGLAGPGY